MAVSHLDAMSAAITLFEKTPFNPNGDRSFRKTHRIPVHARPL